MEKLKEVICKLKSLKVEKLRNNKSITEDFKVFENVIGWIYNKLNTIKEKKSNNNFDKNFSKIFRWWFFIIFSLSLVLILLTVITFKPDFYKVVDIIENFMLKSILVLLFFWVLLPIIFILKINKKYIILYFPIIIFAGFIFKEYLIYIWVNIEELKYHIIYLAEVLNLYVFNIIYILASVLLWVWAWLLVKSEWLTIDEEQITDERKIYNYWLWLVAIFFTIQILLYYYVEDISDKNKAVDYKYCYDLYENNDLEKNFKNCLNVRETEKEADQKYYIKTYNELTQSWWLRLEKDPDYIIVPNQ